MAYVSMVVVGLSAAQVVWALMPETTSVGWMSVVFLGVLGALVGGLVTGFIVHGATASGASFHSLGLVGSMTGTLALVSAFYLVRRRVA